MDLLIPGRARPRVLLAVVLCAACVPDLDTDEALVDEARVLAVQAEPAEAPEGAEVKYTALLADPSGRVRSSALTWYYCTAAKPLAELGPISQACLYGSEGKLSSFGAGESARGTVPDSACSIFGPNPPLLEGDDTPGRPVDPDQTGGYRLPVMLGVDTGMGQDAVLYEQRLTCGLAAVPPRIAVEYAQRYHANENPRIGRLLAAVGGREARGVSEGEVLEVAPGTKVQLRVQWSACPEKDKCGDGICGPEEGSLSCGRDCTEPVGCGGSERYVWYDSARRELSVRREAMRVAWYTTGGTFEEERTGVDESQDATQSKNTWTAPERAGRAELWVVLRDARGGVGFRNVRVVVR